MSTEVTILGKVYNIESITEITLEGCSLQNVPKELVLLTNLQRINLSGNDLKIIPTDLSLLSKLEFLDVSFNLIETIPVEILKMKSLRTLYIFYNPLDLIIPKHYQNNLPEMKYMIEDYITLNKVKRLIAEQKIKAFLSRYVLPKYYESTEGEISLSI